MVYLTGPLEFRFNEEIVWAKTKRATLAWQTGLVEGSMLAVLTNTLIAFTCPDLFDAVGLKHYLGLPKIAAYNRAVIRRLWKFTYSLVGALAVRNMKYDVPPKLFLGLLSQDEERKRDNF